MTLLDAYRVIDLSDERGLLSGTILSDLGAEVFRIEPPEGSSARREFPSGSVWEAWARNCTSLIVDLKDTQERQRFRRLVASADFLIESFEPGLMSSYGLGYEDLASDNPALIYVSISAFGQTGPRATDPATDLTVQAASGMMATVGPSDGPPLRLAGLQSWAHAGAEAACGALIAHHERQRSGLGQHIDVSAQEAVALAAGFQYLSGLLRSAPPQRSGGAIVSGTFRVPTIFQARDGFVCAPFSFGPGQGSYARRLMEWIHEEGGCDEAIRDKDWNRYWDLLQTGLEPVTELERVLGVISTFFGTRDVPILFLEAQRRGVQLVPLYSIADLLEDDHLAERRYWWVATDLAGSPQVPGAFARFSYTPLQYRSRAPESWPLSEDILTLAIRTPRESTSHAFTSGGIRSTALQDVKILDFTWLAAGPWTTRVLCDFGASVVKLESNQRIDAMRVLPPLIGNQTDMNSGGGFHSANAGKMSLDLDLKNPAGHDVVLDLVRWADVLAESFSPRVMPSLGLDFDTLRKIKPDLVMLSTSLFGHDGPYAKLPGVGFMGSALAGFTRATGWPGQTPVGPSGPYTDYVSPRLAIAAILAALDYRDRTGQGQWIDISQLESSIAFLAPEILDWVLNGELVYPMGNRHPTMAPHGVYPAKGDNAWIAIACRNDCDWAVFCDTISRPDLASDDRLSTLAGRQALSDSLETEIIRWTSGQNASAAERQLICVGIPAAAVIDFRTIASEPQFAHRNHILTVPDAVHGTVSIESSHIILGRTPANVSRSAPLLGEDSEHVLRNLLGYDNARIGKLFEAGAVCSASSGRSRSEPTRRDNE